MTRQLAMRTSAGGASAPPMTVPLQGSWRSHSGERVVQLDGKAGFALPVGYEGGKLAASFSRMDYEIVSGDFIAANLYGHSVTWGLDYSKPLARDTAQSGQPGVFAPRDVKVAYDGAQRVLLSDGLQAGEQVVVQNGLLLSRELQIARETADASRQPQGSAKP